MKKLKSVLTYFCIRWKEKKHKETLTKSRLRHMVYMADWKSCMTRQCQITDLQWEKRKAPYAEKFETALRHGFKLTPVAFCVDEVTANKNASCDLTEEEIEILDLVLKTSYKKKASAFMMLTRSTYPMMTSGECDLFHLVELAQDYVKNVRPHL